MLTFPLLKSGQELNIHFAAHYYKTYRLSRSSTGANSDALSRSPLHEWSLQLELIDEQELNTLQSFVEQLQGETGQFTFTDPLDGTLYNNCSLALGSLAEIFSGPGRTATQLVIRENPNYMLIFPQLSTGALTQYPTAKKVSLRSVQSAMEDGTITITLADSSATYLRWKIMLQDLSDQEAKLSPTFMPQLRGIFCRSCSWILPPIFFFGRAIFRRMPGRRLELRSIWHSPIRSAAQPR